MEIGDREAYALSNSGSFFFFCILVVFGQRGFITCSALELSFYISWMTRRNSRFIISGCGVSASDKW